MRRLFALCASHGFNNDQRGGSGFSDTGISGLEPGHFDRRNEVHEEAKT